MKRERKTYEYQCDVCFTVDLASGEELPRGWVATRAEIRNETTRRSCTYDAHLCPECAKSKA